MELLLRTPDPFPHESLLGFVLRTAEENGYDSPWHLLALAGLNQAQMRSAAFPVDRLAAVLGKDASTLQAIAYHGQLPDGQREYRLLGHALGRGLNHRPLRLTKPAVCMQCIEEDGYAHACWDLSAFTACPRHHCALVDNCSGCGAGLSWFRPGLLTCRCGARLASTSGAAADPATVALMAVLQAKVRGESMVGLNNSSGLPLEWLSTVPLGTLLRLLQTLAKFDTDAGDDPASAAEILADWPNGFHAYLRRVGAASATTPGAGLRKRFERLYGALFKRREWGISTALLRDEFVRFGENEWGASLVDRKLRGAASSGGRFVSGNRLAERLGVQPVTMHRWIRKGLIGATEVPTARARRLVVDSRPFDGTLRPLADCLEQREAANYIGLPVSVLLGLRRSGHYSPDPIVNRRRGYWKEDLDRLAKRLFATAPQGRPGELGAEKTIRMGHVVNRCKFGSDDAKSALLAAVLDGKVLPVGIAGTSWADVLLAARAVEDFRLQCSVSSNGSGMSLAAAAATIGCGPHVVRGLLSRGDLERAGESPAGIAMDSIDRFAARWLPVRALASRLGTTQAKLLGAAKVAGVEVLRVRTRGESESLFLQNDDLEMLTAHCSRRGKTLCEQGTPAIG